MKNFNKINLLIIIVLSITGCAIKVNELLTASPTIIVEEDDIKTNSIIEPLNLEILESIDQITINSRKLSGLHLKRNEYLKHDIIAIGDVNGDGYDDILIGSMVQRHGRKASEISTETNQTVKPILLIFNPITNTYEISKEFDKVASSHIWPRQAVMADFDGDGRNDIFIADTGPDGGKITCGWQNSLILNKSTGMVNATHLLPQYSDYSHGLITAKFNKKPSTDLLILNSPYIKNNLCNNTEVAYANKSYLISGKEFKETNINFKFNDKDKDSNLILNTNNTDNGVHFVGASTDLNSDGIPDIVLGNDGFITILESEKILTYAKSQQVNAPAKFRKIVEDKNDCFRINGKCSMPYTYITFYDIDGDGKKEIIANIVHQKANWVFAGEYHQVLKKINGVWKDITESVFPEQLENQFKEGEDCYRLQFADFTGEGKLDMLCANENKSKLWSFNNGQFRLKENFYGMRFIVKFPKANYLINFNYTEGREDSFTLSGKKI